MNCNQCCELLALYVDGSLPVKQLSEIKKHLEQCAPCFKEYDDLAQTLALVCKLDQVQAPPEFYNRFWCRFNDECKPFKFQGWWNVGLLGSVVTAAAVLVVAVLFQPINKVTTPAPLKAASESAKPDQNANVQPQDVNQALAASKNFSPQQDASAGPNSFQNNPMMTAANDPVRAAFQSLVKPVSSNPGYGATMETAAEKTSASGEQPRNASGRLYRQEKEWAGDISAIHQPATLIARNAVEAGMLLKKAKIKSVVLPEINWNEWMLGAIFLGDQNSSGYEIHLNEIQTLAAECVIKYRVNPPVNNSKTASRPFLIFLLPATKKQVSFTREMIIPLPD